jgi:hypothetical protein
MGKGGFSFFQNPVICLGSHRRAPCRRGAAIDPVERLAVKLVNIEPEGFAQSFEGGRIALSPVPTDDEVITRNCNSVKGTEKCPLIAFRLL